MKKEIEIEIQVKIGNNQNLLNFLTKNAQFCLEKHQVDDYFSPVHRNFTAVRPVAEWLRLRNDNNKYSINYKFWHHDKLGRSFHCDEYETKLEDLETAKKIFKALNLKPIATVDKIRKVWVYKDYEIAVDSVKNLGDFVEIEYIGQDQKANPEKVAKEMIDFLKEINCGKIEINYQGYPFLLLFPKEAKYEKV